MPEWGNPDFYQEEHRRVMSEEDEVSESVELAWETGFQRGLAKGMEDATKEFSQLYKPAIEASKARIRQLEEALRCTEIGLANVHSYGDKPLPKLEQRSVFQALQAVRAALRAEPAPPEEDRT